MKKKTTIEKNKIKKVCPHCGGEAEVLVSLRSHKVVCINLCGSWCVSEEVAIKVWNKRHEEKSGA